MLGVTCCKPFVRLQDGLHSWPDDRRGWFLLPDCGEVLRLGFDLGLVSRGWQDLAEAEVRLKVGGRGRARLRLDLLQEQAGLGYRLERAEVDLHRGWRGGTGVAGGQPADSLT